MPTFRYDDAIIQTFPQIQASLLSATVTNAPSSAALRALYQQEQQAVRERLANTPLSEVASLKAWREAFRTFGVDPTKYRSAAESLLRRLTKKEEIPSINTLVDIGNLISIRYALPVAIVDVRGLAGDTLTVHFASGNEPFTPLGTDTPEYPDAGEVIFTDAANVCHARRWCWRQSAASAAREDTSQILVTIEAHHAEGEQAVRNALRDLTGLLSDYAHGTGMGGVAHAGTQVFTA